jgi:hypothetical protein
MFTLYKVTFTEDNGDTFKHLTIPATSLVDAYIDLQRRYPDASITEVEDTDKVLIIRDKRTGEEL